MNTLNISTKDNSNVSELNHAKLEKRIITINDLREANKELYRLYKRR